jgi:hypothetical protein
MLYRNAIGALALAAALFTTMTPGRAWDETKYPEWKGQWRFGQPPRWLQGNAKAPLTPEYQKIFDQNVADQNAGGHGVETSWMCLPPGMPRIMNVFQPMEVVITPDTTYMLIAHIHDDRRIFTDGRPWPQNVEPTYKGYSIGQWIDTDADGRYDTLEVETRGMKGPRQYDTSGLPLHFDNETVVKEKIYQDKTDKNLLWNEITTIDHALTEPWTVKKRYIRSSEPRPNWQESVCPENNPHVHIQGDNYFIGADGSLMPSKRGQAAPDLKYFK